MESKANKIIDFVKDLDFQNVKNLDLSYKNILIIEDLKNLENVTFLNLSNNQIRKIENLNFLKELRELNLSHNFLKKVENLDNNKLITTLNLSWNQISSWENMPNFCKLNFLNLDNNAFEVLKFPDGLKDLKSLSVAMNRIREICIFPNFNKLEEINFFDNEIEKIPAKIFDNCSKLISLDLSKNKISNLNFLTPLKNLVTLNLAENKISELDTNLNIETLENLSLQKNQISETFFLEKIFPNLLTLNISENCLISTYELKFCQEMQYLYDLDFSGNFDLTEEELQSLTEKYRSLERINGKKYRELASSTYELIQELKKEIKEKKYDETLELDIISKDLEFSEIPLKQDEQDEFLRNLEFIEKCKEQEQDIRRRYQTLLGKGKIKELNKKIIESSLNMSFEITQVKMEEEEKMRKSETKFIIRKSKSKYDGSKTNDFPTINSLNSKPITKEKINNLNVLSTASTLALNKTPKELPELKDVRLKDFNKITQNSSSSNKKKQTKSMVKCLGKDLFKPIEVLTLDKRRSELKDNLIKYMEVGRKAGGEPFLVKK